MKGVLKLKKSAKNLALFALVIVLFSFPIIFMKDAPFEGADGMAEEAITEINEDYEPWFSSFFEPQSGEIETLIFSLQAAIGAGVIGYFFGFMKGKRSYKNQIENK